jgi:hypothetical protein
MKFLLRYALFWVVTQRVVVIPCRLLGQPISHISKGQEFLFLAPEDVTDRLSRNVGKELSLLAA